MSSITLFKPYDTRKKNILFLHGFLESSETWKPFLLELSKKYNCLLYDFPGHGLNQDYSAQQIGFEEICKEIKTALTQLQITNTHLICHSMGGYFGCELKKRYPSYFNKVILSNSTLEPDTTIQQRKREKINTIIKTNLSLLCKLSFTRVSQPFKAQKESNCLMCNPEHLTAFQNLLSTRKGYTDLYHQYTTDFFFIFGEKDTQISWEGTKIITKKRQHILPNEEHLLPLNSINEWIRLILDELK